MLAAIYVVITEHERLHECIFQSAQSFSCPYALFFILQMSQDRSKPAISPMYEVQLYTTTLYEGQALSDPYGCATLR